MYKKSFFILLIVIASASCTDYQKLLKSTDADLKYNKAIEYFQKNDFMRAQALFDDVAQYYKGTERSEDVLNYLSRCYMGQKDYYSASEYYKTYVKTYPKGKYVIEAKYMIGHCYYLDSPDARLDQEATRNAITSLQEFIDIYPESPYVKDANKEMEEMTDKLAYKEYLSAKLYYNLGNYLGNNYESAVIVANNALKKYPANKYREDLSFIILEAQYQQTQQSTDDRRAERSQDTIDEYYSFVNEYPNSKYKKAADKIFSDINKKTKD